MNAIAILTWVLGLVNVLSGVMLGWARFNRTEPLGNAIYLLGAGLVVCAAAYCLRSETRWSAAFVIGASLLTMYSPSFFEVAIVITIVTMTIFYWKQLA